MALSHGDWSFSDGWITIGLALWALVAVLAEMYLWPAERRLQAAVSSLTALSSVDADGLGGPAGPRQVGGPEVTPGHRWGPGPSSARTACESWRWPPRLR